MGTDGARGLFFCAAKRSGAFPPNMPAGLCSRLVRFMFPTILSRFGCRVVPSLRAVAWVLKFIVVYV